MLLFILGTIIKNLNKQENYEDDKREGRGNACIR